MKRAGFILLLLSMLISVPTMAQRRARPGNMKHTSSAEAEKAIKKTPLKGRNIKDKSVFGGDVYMVGDAGGIKIGEAVILFNNGRYYFDYTAGEFKMRTSHDRTWRKIKGISDAQYERMWKYEKLGDDFSYSGKYSIIQQGGNIDLILYAGDSDAIFAKIPLENADVSSFEFYEDQFYFQMDRKR